MTLAPSCSLLLALGLGVLALPAQSQIPNTLLHAIPAPASLQAGAEFGSTVAVSGSYVVVGAPFDDTGAENSGVVKVFDAASGALLHTLLNPTPASNDNFGAAIAIDGSRVVVGAYLDDAGATDSGAAYVYDLASGTPTVPFLTLTNPTPASTDYFSYSVAISGTRVAIGTIRDDTAATDAGAVYIYDIAGVTPGLPIASLFNPGPPEGDYFGFSVGISGALLVVGAVRDDTGATDAGSAYVFDLLSATPTSPVATLNNPTPATADQFARCVAISGTRVVVGAWQDDTGGADSGIAYVYDMAGGTPTVPTVVLTNPGPAPTSGDDFGLAVAISGAKVVVGAWRDDVGASNAGSAYVFDVSGPTPTVPVVTLRNPAPAATDQFGYAAAISGATVVVGANLDDAGEVDAGSAYIYHTASGTPSTPVASLNAPGPAFFDQFGASVAVAGSLVVVGASLDDTAAADAGTVRVFDKSSPTPTVPIYTLQSPETATGRQFGGAVAISGTRIVVGAQFDDTGASNAGRAYVFDLASPTPLTPIVILPNPDPTTNDNFGVSVTISGNLVGVGALFDDAGATDAGSVYVFDVNSVTPNVPVYTLNNPTPTTFELFGSSVSMSGTRIVVGAHFDNSLPGTQGSAYVYDLAGATPTTPFITLHSPTSNRFGYSVSMSGSRIAVGAYTDDTGATDAGSAYVFDLTSGTPDVPVATLRNPEPNANDQFGKMVAISGTRVVIGSALDDTGATDAGSAYIFDLNSAVPDAPVATLRNPTPAASDVFGISVAIDGTVVVVGAQDDDTTAAEEGAAYIFGPHPLDQDSDGLRDSWEQAYWATTAGHSALDDFDRDGICELLELAFGLNPTLPSTAALPTPVNESGYLTMTLTKQPGATYEVQSAGTLLPAQPDSFSAASTTVLIDHATTLKVRDNFLIATSPNRFMRVKVTAAP